MLRSIYKIKKAPTIQVFFWIVGAFKRVNILYCEINLPLDHSF